MTGFGLLHLDSNERYRGDFSTDCKPCSLAKLLTERAWDCCDNNDIYRSVMSHANYRYNTINNEGHLFHVLSFSLMSSFDPTVI